MSAFPRRSPRLNQQSQNTFIPQTVNSIPSFQSYSQSSSISSSSHPSPTNDNISLADQSQQYPLHTQSQFLAPAQIFNAPLPSPSANDINPFFGRNQYYDQAMGGQQQQQHQNSNSMGSTQNTSIQNQSQQTQQQHHNSFSQPQRPSYPPTSVNGVPPGLPPDFLAEAAKRAEMACLMRDMGDVSL
ncbi:hypothetical protein H2198_006918 [Neophaeococcomyces mojaviensis]|uniref:Uncharacterized protein n=1 Tax=Neophaeococcomyces mojaviensis TaxID=3383035 RepID=A0ACC3A1P3_9EURO|nr:hypothetical protein H2198_006918 [Knufia sp. JES_112]